MSLIFKRLMVLVAILATPASFASSNDDHHEEHKEEFNAGDLILEHVQDQHTIHIGSVHIPLPIILIENGLQTFSSAEFYHNPKNAEVKKGKEMAHVHYYEHGDYILFEEKVRARIFQGILFEEAEEMVLNPIAEGISINELELKESDKKEYKYSKNGEEVILEYYELEKYIVVEESVYIRTIEGPAFANGSIQNSKIVLDLSITKNVVGIFLALIVFFFVFRYLYKAYKNGRDKAPKGLQTAMESLIVFVRDEVAKPCIGHGYARYMPFLLTTFFFILVCNLLGLIPFLGGLNVTGNIAVTLVLATIVFIIQLFVANKGFWSHMVTPPGVPGWLLPLMIPIEIVGLFSKPIVLMLRLFANITAGHIILLSFISLTFIFAGMVEWAGYIAGPLSAILAGLMSMLEVLVALLQAYVFTLLAAIYFGMATEEAHH